eukprot:353438-Chlamydomonas_euryale.AAC.10
MKGLQAGETKGGNKHRNGQRKTSMRVGQRVFGMSQHVAAQQMLIRIYRSTANVDPNLQKHSKC